MLYRVIKNYKKYRKLQVMFKVSPAMARGTLDSYQRHLLSLILTTLSW